MIEIGAHRIKLGYADTLTGPLHQVPPLLIGLLLIFAEGYDKRYSEND